MFHFASFRQKLSKNKSFVKTIVCECVCEKERLVELQVFVLHDNSNTSVRKKQNKKYKQKTSLFLGICVYFQRVSGSLQLAVSGMVFLFYLSRDNNKGSIIYFQYSTSLSLLGTLSFQVEPIRLHMFWSLSCRDF